MKSSTSSDISRGEPPLAAPAAGGVSLRVRVQPRSRRDAVTGLYAPGVLKVALRAPAVDGAANAALVAFVAALVGVRRSAVSIASGERSRDKRLLIEGVAQAEAARALAAALAG